MVDRKLIKKTHNSDEQKMPGKPGQGRSASGAMVLIANPPGPVFLQTFFRSVFTNFFPKKEILLASVFTNLFPNKEIAIPPRGGRYAPVTCNAQPVLPDQRTRRTSEYVALREKYVALPVKKIIVFGPIIHSRGSLDSSNNFKSYLVIGNGSTSPCLKLIAAMLLIYKDLSMMELIYCTN
jgi:hypothetical protein